MLIMYGYQKCSTCRDAAQWLRDRGVAFEERAIRETPPTVPELRAMLDAHKGELTRLFNTSGMDYRALGMKDKLPTMSVDEALKLLSGHGNLVKRPFLLDPKRGIFLTGFKPEAWEKALKAAK